MTDSSIAAIRDTSTVAEALARAANSDLGGKLVVAVASVALTALGALLRERHLAKKSRDAFLRRAPQEVHLALLTLARVLERLDPGLAVGGDAEAQLEDLEASLATLVTLQDQLDTLKEPKLAAGFTKWLSGVRLASEEARIVDFEIPRPGMFDYGIAKPIPPERAIFRKRFVELQTAGDLLLTKLEALALEASVI